MFELVFQKLRKWRYCIAGLKSNTQNLATDMKKKKKKIEFREYVQKVLPGLSQSMMEKLSEFHYLLSLKVDLDAVLPQNSKEKFT